MIEGFVKRGTDRFYISLFMLFVAPYIASSSVSWLSSHRRKSYAKGRRQGSVWERRSLGLIVSAHTKPCHTCEQHAQQCGERAWTLLLRQVTRIECRVPLLAVPGCDTSSYGEFISRASAVETKEKGKKKDSKFLKPFLFLWLKFKATRPVQYTWEHRYF